MSNNPKPLKRFGQNYLVDQNIVKKIIAEFDPDPKDIVIEIGPGRGVLTDHLSKELKHFYAIEIDKRVIDDLRNNFKTVTFINDDFLQMDLSKFAIDGKKLRIIGNIPYNITSPIIFKLIDNLEFIDDALFMIQLEVANRIKALPRTKEYGILSVILNHFFDVKLCFKVAASVFRPKPKVDSAIIKLKAREIDNNFDKSLFKSVVKAAFGNRRKNLKNSLSNSIFRTYNLDAIPVDLSRRAEEFTIKDYLLMYEFFKENNS